MPEICSPLLIPSCPSSWAPTPIQTIPASSPYPYNADDNELDRELGDQVCPEDDEENELNNNMNSPLQSLSHLMTNKQGQLPTAHFQQL